MREKRVHDERPWPVNLDDLHLFLAEGHRGQHLMWSLTLVFFLAPIQREVLSHLKEWVCSMCPDFTVWCGVWVDPWSFLKYLMIRAVVHRVKLGASQSAKALGRAERGEGADRDGDTEKGHHTAELLNLRFWRVLCLSVVTSHGRNSLLWTRAGLRLCFKVVVQRQLLSVHLYGRFGEGRGLCSRTTCSFSWFLVRFGILHWFLGTHVAFCLLSAAVRMLKWGTSFLIK